GRGKKKNIVSSKEVVFAKADRSPSETAPEVTFDYESEDDIRVPNNESAKLVKKKALVKSSIVSPSVSEPSPTKKVNPSTKQLLISLMEEVKGIKEQIKPSSDNSAIVSQTWSSKSAKGKQKNWFIRSLTSNPWFPFVRGMLLGAVNGFMSDATTDVTSK
nr:hypothetical protein [Tanacetum cinerariifolium]